MTALRERMQLAAGDAATAEPLAMVDATVLVLPDDEAAAVWLGFCESGLTVGDPPADTEPDIRLWMDDDLLRQFPCFYFALAMADGRMRWEGDVRELIAVNPVLRTAVDRARRQQR